MDYAEIREVVRLRHELRRLREEGRREEARAVLDRLRAIAERDPDDADEIEPEIRRWESSLGLA